MPLVASTLANDPLEDGRRATAATRPASSSSTRPRTSRLAESLVRRAEAAGYKAIVVTLDTWVTGWRPRDLNAANFPQLRGACAANYFGDPVFRAMLAKPPERGPCAPRCAMGGDVRQGR